MSQPLIEEGLAPSCSTSSTPPPPTPAGEGYLGGFTKRKQCTRAPACVNVALGLFLECIMFFAAIVLMLLITVRTGSKTSCGYHWHNHYHRRHHHYPFSSSAIGCLSLSAVSPLAASPSPPSLDHGIYFVTLLKRQPRQATGLATSSRHVERAGWGWWGWLVVVVWVGVCCTQVCSISDKPPPLTTPQGGGVRFSPQVLDVSSSSDDGDGGGFKPETLRGFVKRSEPVIIKGIDPKLFESLGPYAQQERPPGTPTDKVCLSSIS
jgi:hypothetical protein